MKRQSILLIGGAVVVAAVSFVAGMQMQKVVARSATSANGMGSAQPGAGGFGRPGGGQASFRRNGTFGQVVSISGTAMTVTTRGGATVNVSLASNPTVTDSSGNQAAISSIQAGDSVAVTGAKGSDGIITATRVRILPANAGGSGSASPSSGNNLNTDGATPSGT